MPVKPKSYPKIKVPNAKMMAEARKMAIAKREMQEAKDLGRRHIIEVEAEAAMYKHAMNLSEEMWKHYNEIIARSKNPKKEIVEAREQAETDFKDYSLKYESMRKHIEKRMTPKKVIYK